MAVQRSYGWRKDRRDTRDFKFCAKPEFAAHVPQHLNMAPMMAPVYDQGRLGSCTGNAIAAAYEFDLVIQKVPHIFRPSRLYIYFNEREMEGTVNDDAGAEIRDGIKTLSNNGVCPEIMWPYSDDGIKFKQRPTPDCYAFGEQHQALIYRSVPQNLAQIQSALALGFPVVFGFNVYDAFEGQQVATTGVLNMPTSGEAEQGGHAVLCCGYDNAMNRFIVRNSWGTDWGQKGYFSMPYDYMLNPSLANDFWTIRRVQA